MKQQKADEKAAAAAAREAKLVRVWLTRCCLNTRSCHFDAPLTVVACLVGRVHVLQASMEEEERAAFLEEEKQKKVHAEKQVRSCVCVWCARLLLTLSAANLL